MKVLRWLLHRPTWQRLPIIPRQYGTQYDPTSIDADTALLMQLTQIRSPNNITALQRRYKATTARELIEVLPPRQRPRRLRQKAMSLVRRAFGVTSYDPTVKIVRPYRRRGRRRI